MRHVLFVSVLVAACSAAGNPETRDPKRVLERARDAHQKITQYEIRVVAEFEHRSPDFETKTKTKLLVAADAAKFRIEQPGMGGFLSVSDGTNMWTYRPQIKQYVKAPPQKITEAIASSPAAMLVPPAPDQISALRLLDDEPVSVDGAARACYVIEFAGQKGLPTPVNSEQRPSRAWIDKATSLVLKRSTEHHMREHPLSAGPADMRTVLAVESMRLHRAPPDELFTFTPPKEARLVSSFEYPGMKKSDLIGKPAPDFTLRDLAGKEVKLAALRGKTVLLNFWTTWCGPCRTEVPVLQKLHDEEKDVALFAVNVGEDSALVQKFVDENKVNYPVLLTGKDKMPESYQVQAFPTAVIIDQDGIVRAQKVGSSPNLESELRAALRDPSSLPSPIDAGVPAPQKPKSETAQAIEEPRTAEEAYRRAIGLARERKLDQAAAMFSKTIAMKPDWPHPWAERARIAYQERRYGEAIKDLDEALRLDPENAGWYDARGLVYSHSGHHSRAIEDYNRAIELNPNVSASYYNNRGWALNETGHPDKALPDLSRAIQMQPGYQVAYENRAIASQRLKNYEAAIADYTAAMQIRATRWQYERRAEAKRAGGDAEGAEEDMRKAADLGPHMGQAPPAPHVHPH